MLGPFHLRHAILQTLKAPQDLARTLVAYNPPAQARWIGLAVVVILSGCLGILGGMILHQMTGGTADLAGFNPLTMAAMQAALIIYGAGATVVVGRLFNGQGKFLDALLLLTWIEFVLVVMQVVQLVLLLVAPVTFSIISILLIAVMFYLLVQFIAALHGFRSLVAVGICVICTFFASAMLAGVVLVSLGFVPATLAN